MNIIPEINWKRVDTLIALAMEEDLGTLGDTTTNSVVPEDATATAVLICKEPDMIVAGLEVAERVFKTVDHTLKFEALKQDGDRCEVGEKIAVIIGSARGLLSVSAALLPLPANTPPPLPGPIPLFSIPARPLPATAIWKNMLSPWAVPPITVSAFMTAL